MSILDGIKEKAKVLIDMAEPYAIRQTASYDAAKNKVIVAGITLDGVVSSVISADTLTIQETGIDYHYTTFTEALTQRTLVVNLLPTARCLPLLRLLALRQLEGKGWFNVSIHENDKLVNVYRGWIMELPEISMQQEADDRSITFGIKPMFWGVSVIDQPTDTELAAYTRYGVSPSTSGIEKEAVLTEEGEIIPPVFVGEDSYTPTPDLDIPVPDVPTTPINP